MAERRNVMAEWKGMVERRNAGRECHDRAKIMSHQQRHGRAERNVKATTAERKDYECGGRDGRNGNREWNRKGDREGGNRKVDVVIGNGTGRDVTAAGNGGREHFKAEGNISFLKRFPSSALGGALP